MLYTLTHVLSNGWGLLAWGWGLSSPEHFISSVGWFGAVLTYIATCTTELVSEQNSMYIHNHMHVTIITNYSQNTSQLDCSGLEMSLLYFFGSQCL